MIHLDTGFLIHALVPDSSADHKLRGWLSSGIPLGISTIVWAEFLCGPVEAREIELATRVIPERVPFEEEDAVASAPARFAGEGTLLPPLFAAFLRTGEGRGGGPAFQALTRLRLY